MGIVNQALLLEKGLRADFVKAFNNGEDPNDVMPFIMTTSSTSNKENYGWLGSVPNLTEWKDERTLHGLRDFDYELPNKHYEATLQVDRDNLADDQLGAIKIRIADLARKAKLHPRKLFFEALLAGTTELCYDGQFFFDTDHSEGDSGTQSNLLTGTGTTLAQLQTDFIAARAAMENFKDDQGEPLNEGELSLYIVAPPALRGRFEELINASIISNTTNTLKGAAKLLTTSRITDVNDWYLIETSGTLKPFIKQIRQSPVFEALEGNSDRGFMSKRFAYGIDHRMGFGYGLWQKAIKTTNA